MDKPIISGFIIIGHIVPGINDFIRKLRMCRQQTIITTTLSPINAALTIRERTLVHAGYPPAPLRDNNGNR